MTKADEVEVLTKRITKLEKALENIHRGELLPHKIASDALWESRNGTRANPDAFWTCVFCSTHNREDAKRCSKCTARASAARPERATSDVPAVELCGEAFDEGGPTCTLPKGHDMHSCEMPEWTTNDDINADPVGRDERRPNDAPLVPSPVVTDLGCWVCRVLADAVKASAVDLAMYQGMIVGARIALGAPPVLCRDHAERWARIGIEEGLETTVREANGARTQEAKPSIPWAKLWLDVHDTAAEQALDLLVSNAQRTQEAPCACGLTVSGTVAKLIEEAKGDSG